MTTARTTLTQWGNRLGVWLYRRSDGRLAGPGKGTTIGLLTVAGRTTGLPRTATIGFFTHGTGYLVAGSASGARRDPQWFRNLRAAPHAHIQIGAAHMDADVRIAGSAERDMLWQQVILAQAPWRRRYEKKAGRIIPVAVLTPRQLTEGVRGLDCSTVAPPARQGLRGMPVLGRRLPPKPRGPR